MSVNKRKKCEICKIKTCRMDGKKRLFMARFPLDEDRCKQWVAATGNENLIHMPLEKLNQLKYICGKHFHTKDFKKKKTQLKKNAVPRIDIAKNPLTDDMFESFPLHIQNVAKSDTRIEVLSDHNYCSHTEPSTSEIFIDSDYKGKRLHSPKETTEEPSEFDDDFAPTSPSPPSPVPRIEAESAGSGKLFSWQKSELIPADDVEEPLTLAELEEQNGISLYCDDTPEPQTVPQVPETSIKEVEYRCKDCGEIDGFQFWCVQCVGCALCGACEARGEHKLHYVLRAPPHRPYKQTQVVLATIRHQLQNENLLTQLGPDDDGVKLEVKEEPPEEDCSVVNVNTVPREPDPLDAADPLRHEPAPDEPHHTATEETPHPPFKRPRLADYIEKDFTNRGTPLQVKVTSRPKPHEQILINLDNVDDQVEFVTEELETDDRDDENTDIATEELEDEVSDEYSEIETIDDDYSIEDDDSIDSRIDEDEDATIINETVEVLDDDVDSRIDEDTDVVTRINEIDGVKVVEALTVRRVRRETGMLQARGSPESMVRSLPSEAVVELRPLSSVEIRKWAADSKKRRK